jgi:hypothetical protein
MKIGGIEVTTCEEVLVLPRGGEGKDIPIRATAVSIIKDFHALVPLPTPPMVVTKNGKSPDLSDKDYKAAVSRMNDLRFAYLVLRSIEPSNIEWSTVDMEKPNTWTEWSKELLAAGFSEKEVERVIDAVLSANSLDEAKLEAARRAFLRGQEA